jgi:hypothetical protein
VKARSRFSGAGKPADVRAWCEKDLPVQFAAEQEMHARDAQLKQQRRDCVTSARDYLKALSRCGLNVSDIAPQALCRVQTDRADAFSKMAHLSCGEIASLIGAVE